MQKTLTSLLLLLACLPVLADKVTLKNGLVLEGNISKIYLNKLTLETDYSEPIVIDFKKVKSFECSKVHSIKFDNEETLTGKFAYDGETIKLLDEETPALKATGFAMLWPKDKKAPDYVPPFKSTWESKVSVDINKEKGNSDETELTLRASTKLTRKKDTLRAKTKIEKTKKNDRITEDELELQVDYERLFQVKGAWYIRFELEKDDFEDLQARATLAGGYSHYFVKNAKKTLRTRFGLLFRKEEYQDESNNQETIGLDLGLKLKYEIVEHSYWYSDLTFTPSVEDFQNYRAEHESGLAVSLADSNAWTLKLGVEHEYNSQPVVEVNKLDTTYFTRLELKF